MYAYQSYNKSQLASLSKLITNLHAMLLISDWIFQNGISQNLGKCERGGFSQSQSHIANLQAIQENCLEQDQSLYYTKT